ncbi:uncharacterized protein RB166_017324 [Leptodactylus fuscus]
MKTDMLVLLIALNLCALCAIGYGDDDVSDDCLAKALQSPEFLKRIYCLVQKYKFSVNYDSLKYDFQEATKDLNCDKAEIQNIIENLPEKLTGLELFNYLTQLLGNAKPQEPCSTM